MQRPPYQVGRRYVGSVGTGPAITGDPDARILARGEDFTPADIAPLHPAGGPWLVLALLGLVVLS